MLRILALTAVSLFLPAALLAQDTAKAELPTELKIRRDPQVISQQEFEAEVDVRNAMDLVRRLRPFWIRTTRGPSSVNLETSEPVVYVNNTRMGSPSVLLQYSTAGIKEIRHLRGTEASMRFGMAHENGAILLTLR